jgi:hypothetical protein
MFGIDVVHAHLKANLSLHKRDNGLLGQNDLNAPGITFGQSIKEESKQKCIEHHRPAHLNKNNDL